MCANVKIENEDLGSGGSAIKRSFFQDIHIFFFCTIIIEFDEGVTEEVNWTLDVNSKRYQDSFWDFKVGFHNLTILKFFSWFHFEVWWR